MHTSCFCDSFCVAGYIEPVEAEDYLALTDREEQDLEKLMSQCEFGISNAEAFMENLAKDLSILDGVCMFYLIFKYLKQRPACWYVVQYTELIFKGFLFDRNCCH
jgi:hypothetical protein